MSDVFVILPAVCTALLCFHEIIITISDVICDTKAYVRNVKVIPSENCVPKHVVDMQFNTTKRWHKKYEPRVRV